MINKKKTKILQEQTQNKRVVKMTKTDAAKFRADQQKASAQPVGGETKSDGPGFSELAIGLGLQYGLSKIASKTAEETAKKTTGAVAGKAAKAAAKKAAGEVAANTVKGEFIKRVITGVRTTGFYTTMNTTVGATYATHGIAAAAGAVVTAVAVGATVGYTLGYLLNSAYSWFGKGYGEIVKTTIEKANKDPNFLRQELEGYKIGGYKYELGDEQNKEDWGFGLSTKGERVKTGILGFGNEVRTPNRYDAKDGPIIIGLLSILYNNEKNAGKIKESTESVDGEEFNVIDISQSAMMGYEKLLNLFGDISPDDGEFRPNNLMYSKVPENFRPFVLALAIAYSAAKIKSSQPSASGDKNMKISLKESILKEFKKILKEEEGQKPNTSSDNSNAAKVDPPTFKEWLATNNKQELYNKLYEGIPKNEIGIIQEEYPDSKYASDMAVLNENLDKMYVRDENIEKAYSTMAATRKFYGLKAIRKLSDGYQGGRKEWWTSTKGDLSSKSALYNEIDDVDTEAGISNLGLGGSSQGAKKDLMLNMIRLSYDPNILEVEQKEQEYLKKGQEQETKKVEEQSFSPGKIVQHVGNKSLYKVLKVNGDKIDVSSPANDKPIGTNQKQNEFVLYSPKFNKGDKIKFVGPGQASGQLFLVSDLNADGTIKVSSPTDPNKILGQSQNSQQFIIMKEFKEMSLKNKILKELKYLLNEDDLQPSGVTDSEQEKKPEEPKKEEEEDVEKLQAQDRMEQLLARDFGTSLEKPFPDLATYEEFLKIQPAAKVYNKIKPAGLVYYIDKEVLYKDKPTYDKSIKTYVAGTKEPVEDAQYSLKGFSASKPFDNPKEAKLVGNADRKNRIIYFKENEQLCVAKYDASGKPAVFKPGADIYFTAKPGLGTYKVGNFVDQGDGTATLTIVGAPAKKGGQPQTQSGEDVKNYTLGVAPPAAPPAAPAKESKTLYGKILKELKTLLNEEPKIVGVGADPNVVKGMPGSQGAAQQSAAKTYTPAQKAQQMKYAEEIRAKLGLPAGKGLDTELQNRINTLRAANTSFPKRAGDLTASLTNIQKWVSDPQNAEALKKSAAPAAGQPATPAAGTITGRNCPNNLRVRDQLVGAGSGDIKCPFKNSAEAQAKLTPEKPVFFWDREEIKMLDKDGDQVKTSFGMSFDEYVKKYPLMTQGAPVAKESWSIRNKNKYSQNLFERLINDVAKKGNR